MAGNPVINEIKVEKAFALFSRDKKGQESRLQPDTSSNNWSTSTLTTTTLHGGLERHNYN
jgi:hypothetical protein